MNLVLALALLQTWHSGASMVTPGWGMATATIGDRVYCIGGKFDRNDSLFPRMVVEAYDAKGDSWITGFPDLPVAHCYPGSAVLDGKIYVVAGSDGNRVDISRVDRFDPNTGTWDTLPSLPGPRNAPAACAFDGAVYVAGGLVQYGAYRKSVYRYEPGGNWELVDSLNTPRACLGLVTAGGRLNAVGGSYYSNLKSVEYYGGDTWAYDLRYMTSPRGGLAAVGHGDWIYAIGGFGKNGVMVSSVEYINLEHGVWTPMMPIDQPRAHLSAAGVEGKLVVIGGLDPWQNAIGTVLIDSTLFSAIEESNDSGLRVTSELPSIVRDVLFLPPSSFGPHPSSLLDASGRRVATLHPGSNDLRGVTPGVYFVQSSLPRPVRIAIVR